MFKKHFCLSIILCLFILIFPCGCSDEEMFSTDETNISINKKGVVTYTIYESFDKSYYNETELKDTIDFQIAEYCEANSNNKAVKLDEYYVKDGIACVKMIFATGEDFSAFNGVDFFYGTVSEAIDKGYITNVSLKNVEDGTMIGQTEFVNLTDNMIAIVSESVPVIVQKKKILYTTANVDVYDKNVAKMSSESSGLAFIVLE